METEHKPLVPLLGTKALDELPPRVLRFRLRLMRFQFNIVHVPGKNLITADALSRAPADVSSVADSALEQEVDAFMAGVTDSLPATDQRLQEILTAQQDDPICTTIGSYCSVGWPPQDRLSAALKSYWPHRSDFSSTPDGLLLFGQRIIIPSALRLQVLDQIHTGHQGITKCRQRARQSVWWPGISAHLQAHVENCQTCARQRMQRRLRTSVPITSTQRQPSLVDQRVFKTRTEDIQQRQQRNYNERHRARELPDLPPGTHVYIPDRQEEGQTATSPTTRSYIVTTPSGDFRRNRRHITPLPQPSSSDTPVPSAPSTSNT